MIAAIFQGILLGMILSIYIGPVFFLLIETSIKSGVRAAFIMDAGVVLSDMLWILLLYFGIGNYLGTFLNSHLAKVIAGTVFILFGLSSLYRLRKLKKSELKVSRKALFRRGFLLNSVNPSVALFWLATIALAVQRFKNDKSEILFFFISLFCTVLLIDIFKFSMAKKLRPFLNDLRQNRLSLITGLIMIIFGIFMISSNPV